MKLATRGIALEADGLNFLTIEVRHAPAAPPALGGEGVANDYALGA